MDESVVPSDQNLETIMSVQLVVNEKPVEPPQIYTFEPVMMMDRDVTFPFMYSDLPYNALITVTIWCTNKNREESKPLGGTTISLFDEDFRLREGKFLLHIWPNTYPDHRYETLTPGLVQDANI